jgi:hypothetical protein
MVKVMSVLFFLFASVSYGQECSQDLKVTEVMSPCQMGYYKFAPSCAFGDVNCLSLVLHGLVNKDLFEYRPDLRRVYNTPLKRKTYSQTAEYQSQYQDMIKDLSDVRNATFCGEMRSYWVYDISHEGFTFLPQTLIPKGRLYRLTNIPKVATYDLIKVSERDAIDIESWETLATMKMVFFKLSQQTSGYVDVDLTQIVWLIPTVSYDHEGEAQISYEEGCVTPAYYRYKVGQ